MARLKLSGLSRYSALPICHHAFIALVPSQCSFVRLRLIDLRMSRPEALARGQHRPDCWSEFVCDRNGDNHRSAPFQQRLNPWTIHSGACLWISNNRTRTQDQEMAQIPVSLLGNTAKPGLAT